MNVCVRHLRLGVLAAACVLAAWAAVAVVSFASPARAANAHRVVLAVDRDDPDAMNLALNNAANLSVYYDSVGEHADVEIVAYGPGFAMMRADTSPVKERIADFVSAMPNVHFSACGVTKTALEKKEGHAIALVPGAQLVPSGVVRIVTLEEQGWSYLKV